MAVNEDVVTMLSSVDLFRQVPPAVLRRIAGAGRVVEFAPGHEVTTDGQAGIAFHMIMDGEAELEVRGRSRPPLGPGASFGEISMIDGGPRTATVRAGANGLKTFALASWEFTSILDENPAVARDLLLVLCGRLRRAEAALPD